MPSLRFEEFEGDETWKLYELGEVMSIVTDYVAAGSFADIAHNVKYETEPNYAQLVRTVDIKHKFKNNNFVYVDRTGFEFLWRVNLDKQSIILPNIGANIGEVYHITKSQLPYHRNVLGPNAILLKTDYNTPFMYNLFQTNTFQRNLKIIIASSGQPKFNKTELKQIEFFIPKKIEQEKIGKFFVRLDELIQLQQSKVNKVKDIKSAYLSEMFPKEGEKYPKKRFEGFTEPWEEYKLKDMGRSLTGLSGKSKKDFGHGEAEFVTYMNVFNNPIAKSTQTAQVEVDENQTEVEYGDIFFTVSSETPNEVGMSSVWLYNRPNVYLNSFCFGFRPTINLNPYYMAYMLRSPEIRKRFILLAQGISRYNISKTKAMELLFPIPSNEEQEKIGQFFKNLDNQISIEEEKLVKLEKLKQAYLNDMFV